MFSKSMALIFRLGQLICAVVIMSLVGHMLSTSYWNQIPKTAGNAAEVNYTMFLSVFSILSLLFLGPASWKYFTDQSVFMIASVLDGLNALFYMCDAIALAAALEVHSCSNPVYTEGNRITQTSPNTKLRCREAQAATAFVWVAFILFTITTAFSLSMSIDSDLRLPEAIRSPRNNRQRDVEERPGYPMEEASGGPMIADDLPDLPRANGRTSRTGSLNGGYWNASSSDNVGHVRMPSASYGRGGGRVINLPVGGPEFTDDEGTGRRSSR